MADEETSLEFIPLKEKSSSSRNILLDFRIKSRYKRLFSARKIRFIILTAVICLLILIILLSVLLNQEGPRLEKVREARQRPRTQPNNSVNVRVKWPGGKYGLPKAKTGCPAGTTFTWKTGWRIQHTEKTKTIEDHSVDFHLGSIVEKDTIKRYFCMKTNVTGDSGRPLWPKGQYCIYKRGDTCPEGLSLGWIKWDDEDRGNLNSFDGTLPDGRYDMNTLIHFCCRTDGEKDVPVILPTAAPFYLLAYGSAACQQVKFALASEEWLRFQTEDTNTKNEYGGKHPHGAGYGDPTMHYCYYTSCNYTLTANWGTFESPNYPLAYHNGQYCSWKITVRSGFQIALKFPSFALQPNSNADNVQVFDGVDDTASSLGVFSSKHIPPSTEVVSSSNNMFIIFKSDASKSNAGFIATYTSRYNITTSFNECSSNPCQHGGSCTDQLDGYTCTCAAGFTGIICQSILPECRKPVGIGNGTIKDFQLTASTVYNDNGLTYGPQHARTNRNGWMAKNRDTNPWIQIDFMREIIITGLATQGYRDSIQLLKPIWVTSYQVTFTMDGKVWNLYKEKGNVKVFKGNHDSDTLTYHTLHDLDSVAELRILPKRWHEGIGMRMELYGCHVGSQKKGLPTLAHWALDGKDASISLFGGPTFVDGRYPGSKAINFNKTSDCYAKVPKLELRERSFTIACWIKSKNTPGKDQSIFNDWHSPWQFYMGVYHNRQFMFQRHGLDGQWYAVHSTSFVPVDTWCHVAVTWDQSKGVVKLFIDVIEVESRRFSPQKAWYHPIQETYQIGDDGHWSNKQFHGSIMDLYVIDKAMTREELNYLRGFPKFTMDFLNNTLVYANEEVVCQATGLPTPYVAWVRSGVVLVNQTYVAKVKVNMHDTKYKCVATNNVGTVERVVLAKNINQCLTNPCDKGRVCKDHFKGYTCTCPVGYTGNNCQTEINECSSNPCQNGGSCVDVLNGYNCTCAAGYTGINCQLVLHCSIDPCLNGGSCKEQLDGYRCTCPANYSGSNCQIDAAILAHWMLDGTDSNMILVGGPTFGKGRYPGSKAINFNKNSGCYAKVPKVELRGRSFTIACWIKSINTPGKHQVIFSDWYSPWQFHFVVRRDRRLHFGRHGLDGSWNGYTANRVVPVNSWRHVAITWDQSKGVVKLFLDATEIAHYTFDPGLAWFYPTKATYEIGDDGHWTNKQFHGSIMDLYVINKAITSEELNNLRGFPTFTMAPLNNSFIYENETLVCRAIGLPTPYVTLIQSEVVLVNQTSAANVKVNQYGEKYTCVATNNLGSAKLIIKAKRNSECSSNPCQKNMICTEQLKGFNCSCVAGYTGTNCNIDINECSNSPCLNGGSCTDLSNGYNCTCAANYTGINCQILVLCKADWKPFNGSCYKYFDTQMTWSNAKTQCEKNGSTLVSIHSDEENTFITTFKKFKPRVWIGLHDINRKGTFRWVDGSADDYVNWRPGQPNRGNELAVEINRVDKKWDDYPTSFLFPYVCKYTP